MMGDVDIDIVTEDLNPVQKITANETHVTNQRFNWKTKLKNEEYFPALVWNN